VVAVCAAAAPPFAFPRLDSGDTVVAILWRLARLGRWPRPMGVDDPAPDDSRCRPVCWR